MCGIDRYLILEQKNGQSWCVMPEDLDDILAAVRKANEGDYEDGTDELLELMGVSGGRVWTLASSIATVSEVSIEGQARRQIIDDRMGVDIEEAKNRILREESVIRAVTS